MTLDQAAYGAISKPNAMRAFATALNWSLLMYFLIRSSFTLRTASVIAVFAAITALVWFTMPSAVGISAIWCALYGALRSYTMVDHFLYWSHCLPILLIPPLTQEWGPLFYYLANAAHFTSAAITYTMFH